MVNYAPRERDNQNARVVDCDSGCVQGSRRADRAYGRRHDEREVLEFEMRAHIAILLITVSLPGSSVLAANEAQALPTLSELNIRGSYASVLNGPPFQSIRATARRDLPPPRSPKTPNHSRKPSARR